MNPINPIVNHALLNQAAKFRGWVINGTVLLERLVDVYLSCHFAYHKDKRDELMDLVFAASSGMSFDPKKNLFAIILKKHNRAYYDANVSLLHDIAHIIKQRNIFAHYLLDRNDEALERFTKNGEVGFIKFKEVTETIYFTETDIKKLVDKIEDCIKKLDALVPPTEEIDNAPLSMNPSIEK